MSRVFAAPVFALLFVFGVATAGELSIRQFPLPAHGTLVMAVPDAWEVQVGQPPDGLPPTLKFSPKSGPAFEMLVTPLWPMSNKTPAMDAASLRKEVEATAKAAQPQAVEKTIAIRTLKSRSGIGYYFSATDRKPKPGEYKYLTQGIVPVGDLVVTFTILSNDGADATVGAALLLLQDLGQKKAGSN
jgi:hypothetical protein